MTSEDLMAYFRIKHIRIDCRKEKDLQALREFLLSIDPHTNMTCLRADDLDEFPYAGPSRYDQWVLWRVPDMVTWSIERALSELSIMTGDNEEIQCPNLEDVL